MKVINAINTLNYRSVVSFNFDKVTNQEYWDHRILKFYDLLKLYPFDKLFIGIRVNVNEDDHFMLKLNVSDININDIEKFYQYCAKFVNVKSFYYECKEIVYHYNGTKHINIKINNVIVPIAPNSFVQANHEMGNILYSEVAKLVKPNKNLIVYGRNAFHIASQIYDKFQNVLCINPCKIAFNDGILMMNLNNFMWNSIKTKELLVNHINGSSDDTTIIMSPGRSGYAFFDKINKDKFRNKQFIYITCNEETFKDNIKDNFNIKNNIMIELFPGTKFNEHIIELEVI